MIRMKVLGGQRRERTREMSVDILGEDRLFQANEGNSQVDGVQKAG